MMWLRRQGSHYGLLVIGALAAIAFVNAMYYAGLGLMPHRRGPSLFAAFWPHHRRHHSLLSWLGLGAGSGWGLSMPRDQHQMWLLVLVAACAVVAVSTGHVSPGGRTWRSAVRKPTTRRRVLERPPSAYDKTGVLRSPLSDEELARQRATALEQLRRDIGRQEELKVVLALDTWRCPPPLSREECQLLLVEAVRAGYLPSVLRQLGSKLEAMGLTLDWAEDNISVDKMGRFALDDALDVATNERRNESTALALLEMGLKSGNGATARLNANPFLRAAAMHGMTRFAEKLVLEAGADVNSKDPRSGYTALDVALEAQRQSTATRLVELGARPASSGRGIEWLLRNASPSLRELLARQPLLRPAGITPDGAPPSGAGEHDGSSGATPPAGLAPSAESDRAAKAQVRFLYTEAFNGLRDGDAKAANSSLDALLSATEGDDAGQWLSIMDVQRLLEEAVRRNALWAYVERVASKLESMVGRLDWPDDADLAAGFGQYPLDAALRAAVTERGKESIALSLLDRGLSSGEGSVQRLNPNPLLRAAAAKGMSIFVERLVVDGGADIDAKDPRFGGVALDRAVEAGRRETALTLLELGANPEAGKGILHLMERASPAVAARIREAAMER